MDRSTSKNSARKRAFDRLTGGAIADNLSPPLGIWVNDLRDQTIDMVQTLRKRRPTVFQEIYFDIVDDLALNALACKDDTGEYMGLNVGLALCLPQIVFHLPAQPQLFPNVGDPSKESPGVVQVADKILTQDGGISALDPQKVDWMCPFDYPKDPLRQRFAGYLLTSIWGFLSYHEICHLVRCHIDFLREAGLTGRNDLRVFHEFEKNVTDQEKSIF
jgi:hypothetical protein